MSNFAVDSIKGVLLPVPTPFDQDGIVDEPLYMAMLDFYVDAGVDALVVLGSLGQGATLDTAQRMRTLEIALEAVDGRTPVLPDVGNVDPYRSRQLALHASSLGVTAIVMVGPYYYSDRSLDEVVMHFEMVEAGADLPLLLYNNPSYQGFNLTIEMLLSIQQKVPQLTGMMGGSDSMASVLSYQAALGRDFKIFSSVMNLFPGMLLGVAGTHSPPLAFAPEAGVALVKAIGRGDNEESLRLQIALMRYVQEINKLHRWFRSVQLEALRYLGFSITKFPRWPTLDLPEEAQKHLRRAVDDIRSAAGRSSE